MLRSRPKSSVPVQSDWPKRIIQLRKNSGLHQAAFGGTFHCSAMNVSRWERGISEPSSHTYIEMGSLAGDPLCWYFWERAGLRKEDLLRVMPRMQERLRKLQTPHLEIVTAGSGAKKLKTNDKLQLVAIPVLKTVAATLGEKGDSHALLRDAPIESVVAAPKSWCPNPASTSCLRVRGGSMSPLIHDGYILAVDSSQTEAGGLNGKIVIAWHKDKGLTVSRMHRYDHTLVLRSENPTTKPSR
jgi:SOS-response transcriptional repressor LexA